MTEGPQKFSRRELLKRGAVVGGAVVWATPVVQTLGMGRAFAATPSDTCVASWADQVEGFTQGLTKTGNPVPAARSNPANSLNAPNTTFVSLGYGGELIVRLAVPYYLTKNGEAVVVETSGGLPPYVAEVAQVYVSGSAAGPWVLAGSATNVNAAPNEKRSEIPLDTVPMLPAIVRYVRLVDVTNSGPHDNASDGFDVNAVGIGCP